MTVGTRGISHVCPPYAILRLRDVIEVRWGQVYHDAELLRRFHPHVTRAG